MNIYIGADHRGYSFKSKIIDIVNTYGHNIFDMGSYDPNEKSDYPRIARQVARKVAQIREGRGILVCMTGIGQTIAANKVRGAYAALCYNPAAAALSRKHNNANILVLGSKFVKSKDLKKILDVWFNTEFEGGRHLRRVNQIKRMEKGRKV